MINLARVGCKTILFGIALYSPLELLRVILWYRSNWLEPWPGFFHVEWAIMALGLSILAYALNKARLPDFFYEGKYESDTSIKKGING